MRLANSTAATIAGYLLVLTTALAQQAVDDQMKASTDKFSWLDVNHDGAISFDEATKMKGLPERFAAADANKDGKLDKSEFAKITGG